MKYIVTFLVLMSGVANAADIALILNTKRQQTLYNALDSAVRHQGIQGAPDLVDLLNALRSAPAVEENKPEPKKESSK